MDPLKKRIIEEYWLKKLSGDLPRLSLPPGAAREKQHQDPELSGFASFELEIPVPLAQRLQKTARNADIGIFVLFLCALNIILYRYVGVEDLVVGTTPPLTSGNADGLLFCRTRVTDDLTVREVIDRTRKEVSETINFAEYSLEDIREQLRVANGGSSLNIFNAALIFDPFQNENNALESFEPVFILCRNKENFTLRVKFSTDYYGGEVTRKFSRNLVNGLETMLKYPDRKVGELDILNADEKNQLLYDFNRTAFPYPEDKTIPQLFEEQAAKMGDHIAVIGTGHEPQRLTYKELKAKTDGLAVMLIKKGVSPGTIVGVVMERSIEMIIAIFGILKAGGAYLPIAPDYPRARLLYMLGDSNTKIMLSEKCEVDRHIEVIDLKRIELYDSEVLSTQFIKLTHPAQLCYVIYTSGSTGNPKGVMIEHSAVVNRLNWMQRVYPIVETDVILQKTPFVFDVSVWELFWWSQQGASLCLLDVNEEKNPEAVVAAVGKNGVTTLHFVPSMLQVFLEYCRQAAHLNALTGLRQVFASGEALSVYQVETFHQLLNSKFGSKLVNLYGPTEATVDVSYYNCVPGQKIETIPIGKPIDNINLYIVDKSLHLQPVGVAGELCISGVGLGRGYLNRPELTAEKFINPQILQIESHIPCIFYRTGDLVRWQPDGNVEFLGRIDHQVKIRGFRIELGEIEAQLLKHDGIKGVVVKLKKRAGANSDFAPVLFAYIVVAKEDELNVSLLREYLSRTLPDYMIPSHFIQIEKIPLTSNGKVDFNGLELLGKQLDTGTPHVDPKDEVERKIAGIWQEVLNLDKVGIHDNYFEVGGTSFDIIRINGKLKEVFQVDIPIVTMFRYTTVHSLAEYFNNNRNEETEKTGVYDRSAALERGKMDRRRRFQMRQGASND